jgi:hypothetical protein
MVDAVNRDSSGSGQALIRRTRLHGRWRTFVHPGTSPRLDAHGRPIMGQLVGRKVVEEDAIRPLHLPLLRAGCNSGGACCGMYHHIPATSADRDRVLALLGEGEADLFVEAFKGHPDALNIATVNGRCGFQQDDGFCRIQVAGGAAAKPMSCLSYPAVLVSCGEEWHASVRPECACVARHANEGRLLSDDPRSWAELKARFLRVWDVPEVIVIDGVRTLERAAYVDWMRLAMAKLKTSFEPLEALHRAGQEIGVETTPPDEAWLDRVERNLVRELKEGEVELHADSPLRASFVWALEVFRALRAGTDPEPRWSKGRKADQARRMASVAALVLHGHQLLEWRELGPTLVDLSRFLWLGRASNAVRPAEDVDSRLESITTWIFLWRLVDWE